jgi:hypothetical protein
MEIFKNLIYIQNYILPIVAIIWLIYLGDWSRLIFGVVFSFSSNYILMILSSPNIILASFYVKFQDANVNKFNITLSFLGSFFNSLAYSLYGAITILVFFSTTNGNNLIPYYIASFTIINTIYTTEALEDMPIQVMANHITSIVAILLLFLNNDVLISIIILFIGNIVGAIIQTRSNYNSRIYND